MKTKRVTLSTPRKARSHRGDWRLDGTPSMLFWALPRTSTRGMACCRQRIITLTLNASWGKAEATRHYTRMEQMIARDCSDASKSTTSCFFESGVDETTGKRVSPCVEIKYELVPAQVPPCFYMLSCSKLLTPPRSTTKMIHPNILQ